MNKKIQILLFLGGVAMSLHALEITAPPAPRPYAISTAESEIREYASKLTGQANPSGRFILEVDGKMADNAWSIRSTDKGVLLKGGTPQGLLYAIHHYFEDCCGVRWWSRWEESVPHLDALPQDGLDLSGKPAFAVRNSTFLYASDGGRFASHLRLNGQGPYDKLIQSEWGGARIYGPPHLCHSFSMYIDPKTLGKTHPEWFPLLKGVRTPIAMSGRNEVPGQLCLTNKEMRKHFLEGLKKNIAKSFSDADIKGVRRPYVFDVSQNDGPFVLCECDACQAVLKREGNPSGLLLDFVNEMADGIKDEYPDVLISTLAYNQTEELPKEIKPRDNVLIVLCDTKSNACFPVTDPENIHFKKLVEGWSKIAKNLRIWRYLITFGNGNEKAPAPTEPPYSSEYNWAEDFKFYIAHNVRHIFAEMESPLECDVREYKIWMFAKLTENPYADPAALRADFANGYYGPAGKFFLQYRDLLRKAMDKKRPFLDMRAKIGGITHLNLDTVIAAHKLFDDGAKAIAGDSVLEERWNSARLSLDRFTLVLHRPLAVEFMQRNGSLKGYPFDTNVIADRVEKTLRARAVHYPLEWPQRNYELPNLLKINELARKEIITEKSLRRPDMFKDVPASDYFEFPCEQFSCWQTLFEIKEDDSALSGKAAILVLDDNNKSTTRETYKLPQDCGLYITQERQSVLRHTVKPEDVKPGWNWYCLGRTRLSSDAYVWITTNWIIQVGVANAFDNANPNAQYDIWVNMRFTGPTYPCGKQGEPDTMSVERVVLIRAK